MIAITRYSAPHKQVWDAFARVAKNTLFFFQRDYLEYHADRFTDHSLLFHQDGKLVAVLPANEREGKLVSHGGLTFGGFLIDTAMTTRLMLELSGSLIVYLREQGLQTLAYKCIPHIYHLVPAEEDRYALFVHGARLVRRDVTSTVELQTRPVPQERRRRGAKKALAAGVGSRLTNDFAAFWQILEENLLRAHGVKPVHTLAEIDRLRQLFPENIKLFGAYLEDRLVAGVVVFENTTVAHAQYISANEEGKRIGALDALFSWLIGECYMDKTYFDFGISTEENGRVLNSGLIDQKEGFGARGVVHDHYELDIAGAVEGLHMAS